MAAALLLCAQATLSGCQPPTSLYLINNTGHTVIVIDSAGLRRDDNDPRGVSMGSWGRPWPWPFLIEDGVGRRVDREMGGVWIVDVRVGRCRFRYEAQSVRPTNERYEGNAWQAFDFSSYDITMQLEPDERLYLVALRVPQNGRPAAVDVAPFREIQPEGYPVTPSSRICR